MQFDSGIFEGVYFNIVWYKSGNILHLSASSQIKVDMYADKIYEIYALPFSIPDFYNIIPVGNSRFAFFNIVDNVLKMTPYGENFLIGNWIYFQIPLIVI